MELRPAGPWQFGTATTVSVGAVVAAQAGLVLALLSVGRRHRQTQRRLVSRLQFEQLVTELIAVTAPAAPGDLDGALDATLGRVAACLGIDAIWRWDAVGAEDADWASPFLRAGESASFGDPADLPPSIREKLADAGIATCSALAVPLVSRGVTSGALFAVQHEPLASSHAEELQRLATVVASILQRKRAQIALESSDRLKDSMLDSLVTSGRLNEVALRESEDRFLRMADALPIAIRMSGADGVCNYFNQGWLQLTGRTVEQESGDGWLESVHADERAACLVTYLRALRLREGFTMEYRIRRHDGEYRWVLDTGVPRYGSDGTFHGYVGGCVDITERKEAERMLRNLSHRLMQAQDDERRRIARELHDHLSQQLALLAIDLQQVAMNPSAEGLVPTIQNAWRRTAEIASDVHAISHRLHPSKMEALGLVATIKAHCLDASRQSLTVEFRHHRVPSGLSPDRALSLFRVLEEALSNVIRHSGATEAHVSLLGDNSHIALQVTDNGHGFIVARRQGGGLGLVSMRERLQALGGTLAITSVPGKGTVVEARIPRVGKQYGRRLADAVRPAPLGIRENVVTTTAFRRRAESA